MNETSQGGTMTPPANTSAAGVIPDTLFRQLQVARLDPRNANRQNGYLSVMLTARGGWTFDQAGDFLGIRPSDVALWSRTFVQGGISALDDLPEPSLSVI